MNFLYAHQGTSFLLPENDGELSNAASVIPCHITPRISGAALLRPAACDCYKSFWLIDF
jgi:hypothetical protein